jgi:glycosyltransferase involved in cell wall biosynthesis
MITYNHERFISQALNSALAQDTDFNYEIVVGEDGSDDSTLAIVESIRDRHADRIQLLDPPPHNLGMMRNFERTFRACRGKYIAILEGDDYWTDPGKLQKQVDALKSDPHAAICYHRMKVCYEDGSVSGATSNENEKSVSTIIDLAGKNFIHTASCVFVNNLQGKLPSWFLSLPVADYPLHLLNAQYGDIRFVDEIMGVYRIHDGGVWESKPYKYKFLQWMRLLDSISGCFSEEVNEALKEQKYNLLESVMSDYGEFKKIHDFWGDLEIEHKIYVFPKWEKFWRDLKAKLKGKK